MGLGNKENGKYVSILGGKFCIRIEKPDNIVTPEDISKWLVDNSAVSRVNKLGKTVYEKYYDNFTGKLVGIKVKDGGAYEKQWVFSFQDTGEVYVLQLGYTNSFAKNILKMLPNADLSKEMKLSPSTKVEADGTKKSSIFINQDGTALKHAYTRDNPNGLPPMTQVMVKGSLVWDDTDQMIFLENMVNTQIIPKLDGGKYANILATPATEQPQTLESYTDELNKAGGEVVEEQAF
jgi:hypothetical protein